MFEFGFMQLGLLNTIANAIGKALGKVVGALVVPILNIFATYIMDFVILILKAVKNSSVLGILVKFVIDVVLLILEWVFWYTGLKEVMADGVIKAADGIFKSLIDDAIVNMFAWTPINFFNAGSSNVTTTTGNPYFMSIAVMKDGIMPTAMIIFSLIILIELFQITVRTEGMRNSGFETPFKLMIKVAICKILLDNTQMVLEAIFSTTTSMFFQVKKAAEIASKDMFKAGNIKTSLMNAPWYALGTIFIQFGIQWILVKVVMCVVPFVLFGRVMEMYVYIALAPIPFATFASQELSQIGKNFLKQFIGISLKVVAMYIILVVFSDMMVLMIFGNANDFATALVNGISLMLIGGPVTFAIGLGQIALQGGVKPLIFAIMLLMSIMGSDKYVKAITGAFY